MKVRRGRRRGIWGAAVTGRMERGAESTVYRTYTDRNHIEPRAYYTVMFILKAVFFELLLFAIIHVPVLGHCFWRHFCLYFYDGRNKALICVKVMRDSIMEKGKRRRKFTLSGNDG